MAVCVATYCKKEAYQDGTLSVGQIVSVGVMKLLGGAALHPRAFEKARPKLLVVGDGYVSAQIISTKTFGCLSFVAVYISPAIKENLL